MFYFRDETIQGPATHALVVGVSDYRYLPESQGEARTFGLCKLDSAALSALSFARWLVDNRASLPRPLASVRLLAAPSPAEIANPRWAAALPAAYQPIEPTFAEFENAAWEWRKDAARSSDEVSIFSYTGHGIKLTSDIMLLSDFGHPNAPVMSRAADFANIQDGMARSVDFPMIAGTQFYFVDACRTDLSEDPQARRQYLDLAREVPVVFSSLSDGGSRSVATLYSTTPGTQAQGRPGDVSYFCEALLDALDRASDDPEPTTNGVLRYPVKAGVLSLLTFGRLAAMGAAQRPQHSGLNDAAAVFRYLSGPPTVDVVFELEPDACIDTATVSLTSLQGGSPHQLGPDRSAYPYRRPVTMGFYHARAVKPPEVRDVPVLAVTHNQNRIGFSFDA